MIELASSQGPDQLLLDISLCNLEFCILELDPRPLSFI